jgi:hypothetical protein
METPIYDSTKQSFETIEQQIDNFDTLVNKKVDGAIKSGREYTIAEVEQLKVFFENQIKSLKDLIMKESENQTSKLQGLKDKIEEIKSILEILSSPPNIDTIISWAKSAAKLYSMQYEQTIGRAVDITKTITYVSTEVPILIAKATRLPDVLEKLNNIPVKK